jgi:hypothetical protein
MSGIATLGCGKTHLNVDGITVNQTKEWEKSLKNGGDYHLLEGKSGKSWGAVSFIYMLKQFIKLVSSYLEQRIIQQKQYSYLLVIK